MSKKDRKQPEIIRIRSKYDLWNDFIVEGQKNKWPTRLIKARLLEAIRKEIFDQMIWRMKTEDIAGAPHTPENERIVESIATETKKKWRALIRMCDEHLYTHGMLSEKDLEDLFAEEEPEEYYEEEPEIDEMTSEWPELSEENAE